MHNRITISGIGTISGAGTDVNSNWESLCRNSVQCRPVPEWLFTTGLSSPVFAVHAECGHPEQDAYFPYLPDSPDEMPNRTLLLTMNAAVQALVQAGFTPEALKKKRVGISLGTTVGCTFNDEEYYSAWRRGQIPDPAPVRRYFSGNLASAVQCFAGTRGPTAVITNACASGTDAIGLAANWIAAGLCDLALAGGGDQLSRIAYNGFSSLQLTSGNPCRPFDRNRNGLNLGEGAGVLVLEQEDRCLRRGGAPLGFIRGYGNANDAYHPTAPHPEGRGLQKALSTALGLIGKSRKIAYINAHGTGTPSNDPAEMKALAASIDCTETPIISTKGITGHTLGAAGAIEAIFTLLSLNLGFTPGTPGCRQLDPALPLSPLPEKEERKLAGRLGLSTSLAFGGGNSVLILEGKG